MDKIKKLIPKNILGTVRPIYHYMLAFLGAVIYHFPAKKLTIIGVTGTKGKSSTVEILNAILEEAGFKTAVSGTIRFKIGEKSRPNLFKMSMPGRFFMQKFLRDAVSAGCSHAIIEITSEGAKQFRHKWIFLDALIFTNLAPEHIESHGSYEKYRDAKLSIAREMKKSGKSGVLIVNADDKESEHFLNINIPKKLPFSIEDARPFIISNVGIEFTFKKMNMYSPLIGEFNLRNILGTAVCADYFGIDRETIAKAIKNFSEISGRVEKIKMGQPFDVIVDYAHTPDSLEALYKAFPDRKKICILGNTGGGRDVWKRPVMAGIADKYCDEILLTNEDPYDENPEKILKEMMIGMKKHLPHIILDRREAIKKAISLAKKDDVVLISGKGTDPYIMGPNGSKLIWSDRKVAEEELEKILK